MKLIGGDGAGFLACLFCGTDIGEPAPTVRLTEIIIVIQP